MAAPILRSGAPPFRRSLGGSVIALALASAAGFPLNAEQAADKSSQAENFCYYPKPAEAPAGAPNVRVVLTDDVDFSAASGARRPDPYTGVRFRDAERHHLYAKLRWQAHACPVE